MRRIVLTDADQVKMQRLWYAGLNLQTIGKRFQVSGTRVRKILESQGITVPKRTHRAYGSNA